MSAVIERTLELLYSAVSRADAILGDLAYNIDRTVLLGTLPSDYDMRGWYEEIQIALAKLYVVRELAETALDKLIEALDS